MLAARTHTATIFLRAATRRLRGLPERSINVGAGCRAPLLHPKTSSRFVHATPLILSDDDKTSPLARLSQSNSRGGNNGDTSGRARQKSNNHVTAASVSQTNNSAVASDDNKNDAPYYDYRFDEYNFDVEGEVSQLKSWHEAKEIEFQQLDDQTTKLFDNSSSNINTVSEIMSQIQQWDDFISSITTDMNFDFRTKNPYYPPSEFMTTITYDAAERATSLLMHLTKQQDKSVSPALEVSAHKAVMNAWSNVFHWSSGDRCEEVLEVYGQKFGGDMNYMPSMEDYKTVMKAHLKSCSSHYSTDDSASAGASPGEKALEILNLLNNVYTAGDLFLKPDVELYSHTIAVVRNTLLDWQMRRRFRKDDASLEEQLSSEMLNVLEQMEMTIVEEANAEEKDAKVHSSMDKWRCIIRAYSDAIAVVSRVPLGDEDSTSLHSSDQILDTLEQFVSSNADAILQCASEDASNEIILEEIQRCIEGAYLSVLSSQSTVTDFNTAVANASTSEQMFNRMKERSDNAAAEETKLFPAPTPDHVQSVIRAHLECLRRKYICPEANRAMGEMKELPHLKAKRLLKDLEIQQAGQPIDGSLYSDIAWACTQVPFWSSINKLDRYASAAKSLKALLKHTNDQYTQGSIDFSSVGTSTKMYNYLFELYSQMARNARNFKGKEAAMKQCLESFDDMEFWYKEGGGARAKPDNHTLGLILKTIINSGLPSASDCTQTMVKNFAKYGAKPREGDYLIAMKAANDPNKVEEILRRIKANYDKDESEKPTTALYTECIAAYARSRDQNSASKVMDLFGELNELYESTGDPDFCPDGAFYSVTVDAVTKSKSKANAAILQAIRLIETMEKNFDSGKIDISPNRYAYTSILSSISQTKVPDVALAEDFLRKMSNRAHQLKDDDIIPDTVAYTALLQALARSRSRDKIDKATKWFAELESRFALGDANAKPNKITYNAMINCWRTSGRRDSGEQAQKILDLVEQRYEDGDYDVKPDAMLYSSVIDAWSRGRSTENVERAWDLYSRMKKQYYNGNVDMKPNDIIISTVIKCCGFAQGDQSKKKGLKVLLQCFSEVTSSKHVGQSPATFYALLTSLSKLMGDDAKRRPVAASIFQACVHAGQLNGSVLSALSECQPELYVKLPFVQSNGKYRNEDIPSEWRKNLPQINRGNRQGARRS